MEQEEKLCDDVETVMEFTYLDDSLSAVGGCEAAVTARTRCGWDKFMEYSDLLYGKRFPLMLTAAVNKSYIRPTILHEGEAWCLKESEMIILRRTGRSMVIAMCGVQLKDRKRSTDLMIMLGLNETIDQLAMANNVCWNGHVLKREDDYFLRRALDFEVGGQRKKGRSKRTCKKQVEEESAMLGLRKEDALCRSKCSVRVNKIAAGLR